MSASDGTPEQHFESLDAGTLEAWNDFRPEGAKELFCYVPFSSLSFSFLGRALACVYNQKVELGRYPEASIREIWFESPMGQQLRRHMEHNDLSYGCKHCRYFAEKRKFSGMKPLVFDRYSDAREDLYPRVLEFELSNSCNLECVMCNGQVSSSVRKNREKLPPVRSPYDDEFVRQLEEFLPHIEEAKFYGGEPFLIPIYYTIWDRILDVKPTTKIFTITNGTTLNDRIKDLLERGDFDLAVSMDSPGKEAVEAIRRNVDHETLVENIRYYSDYCRRRGRLLTISFTLMRINWREFPRIIGFCNELGAQLYVSYLKTPPRFAIWNLPAEDIAEIRRSLGDLVFATGTPSEQANERCYQDLMTYLENAENEARTRDPGEIIPWQADGTYPVEEWLDPASENSAAPPPSPAPAPDTRFDPQADYAAVLHERMARHLEGLGIGSAGEDRVAQRLEAIEAKLQDALTGIPESRVGIVYFFASRSPVEELVANLESSSPAQVAAQIRKIVSSLA